MPDAREKRQEIGDHRSKKGYALRLLAQQLIGLRDEPIHAAGRPHRSDGSDDGHDDADDVKGDIAASYWRAGDRQGDYPEATGGTDRDGPVPRAEHDGCEDDQ